MIFSATCVYALRAVTRIATQRPAGFVLIDSICEGTDMPRPFVAKILQRLVRSRLLVSSKGRGGGFALAKPAAEIRVRDVVEAVDGTQGFDQCLLGLGECLGPDDCTLDTCWSRIRRRIEQDMLDVTFEQVARRARRHARPAGGRNGYRLRGRRPAPPPADEVSLVAAGAASPAPVDLI